MGSNLSDIRQIVQQILKDEFDVDQTQEWTNDEIDVHIGVCLRELSRVSPYRVQTPLLLTANSKILDVSSLGHIRINDIEYPVGNSPRSLRNVKILDNETVEMDVGSTPSESGTSGTLTGTVTFTSGSATVTGSGTDFDGELEAGYYIKHSTKDRWYRIYSVDSDTSLTLYEPVKAGDAGADTADATQYRDENVAVVYYDKLHTLTEEKSTLNPAEEEALILGVCGRAAISKARSLVNAVNVGGGSTPQQMQSWGITEITLYQRALDRFTPRGKQSHANA